MPRLPRTSAWRIIAALETFGFVPVRTKGSHCVLKRPSHDGEIVCVVPLYDEIAVGTLRSILRQARITPEDFIQFLTRN